MDDNGYILILANGIMTKQNPLQSIFEKDQAKALSNIGYKVVYLALDLHSIRHRRKLGIVKYEEDNILYYHASFPLGNVPIIFMRIFGYAMLVRAYKRIIKENGLPKVVHAHFTDMGYLLGLLKNKYEFKMILTEHNSQINKEVIPKKVLFMAKRAYRSADRVIAVSSLLAEKIKKIAGVSSVVIPNIIDTTNFSYLREKDVRQEKFIFVSAGALISRKGFDLLIRSYDKAFGSDKNVQLLIIGNGEEKRLLENEIKNRGLSGNIFLLGERPREEMGKIFRTAHTFVLLSRVETFGVVYVEAMAAGLPVIATKCGGPEDFVNGENGILVDVDNEEQAIAAMKEIRNRTYDRKKIAQNVLERFSENIISEQLVRIYDEVCY